MSDASVGAVATLRVPDKRKPGLTSKLVIRVTRVHTDTFVGVVLDSSFGAYRVGRVIDGQLIQSFDFSVDKDQAIDGAE